MRLVFMGTPELAATSLRALLASRHEVVAVVSQPDRPSGRGQRTQPPPVAEVARAAGLEVVQPESVKTAAFRAWVAERRPDAVVVVAFGHVLGPKLLAVPPRGCLNVHASLLPRWRGASPIHHAILAGDAASGVCIMAMDAGLDTGPVLAREAVALAPDETAETLHDRLAEVGARLLVATLDRLEAGEVEAVAQPDEGATYARQLRKEDGDLDLSEPADALARRVRAFHPWPGTRARLVTPEGEVPLKILPPVAVLEAPGPEAPGTVVAAGPEGVDVRCGDGRALRLGRLQAPGRRPLEAREFLAGHPVPAGSRLR